MAGLGYRDPIYVKEGLGEGGGRKGRKGREREEQEKRKGRKEEAGGGRGREGRGKKKYLKYKSINPSDLIIKTEIAEDKNIGWGWK